MYVVSSFIFAGMRNQRAPLPMQEDVLPTEVATEVAKNEKVTRLIIRASNESS